MTLHANAPKLWYVGGEDIRLRIPVLLALRERGFDVAAVGSDDAAPFLAHDIRFHFCPFDRFISPRSDWKSKRVLRELFSRYRPDIVHAFDTKPGILAPPAAQQAKIKARLRTINGLGFIYVGNSPLIVAMRPLWRWLQQRSCAAAHTVIFQNPDDQEFYLQRRLVRRGAERLILGAGIDTTRIAAQRRNQQAIAALRQRLNLENHLVVTMVSRIARHKGVYEFLDAARLVQERAPQTKFLLVGPAVTEGRQAVPLPHIKQYSDCVRYLGMRNDIAQLLAASDVFALPSYNREGIPRSLMEAGAAGLPLVTTDMPGCREVVRDGFNGHLIRPKSTEQLAAALLQVIESPERAEMGRRSQELVQQRFDLAKVVDAHVDVYNELLGISPSQRAAA